MEKNYHIRLVTTELYLFIKIVVLAFCIEFEKKTKISKPSTDKIKLLNLMTKNLIL